MSNVKPMVHPGTRGPALILAVLLLAWSAVGMGASLGPARAHASALATAGAADVAHAVALDTAAAVEWQAVGLYGGDVTSIATDSTHAGVAYVGTRDAGVFKTTDGGQTWQPSRFGLTFFPVRSIAIDPVDSRVIYAGTDNDGVWKSSDGGASWARGGTLPDIMIVFNIVVEPSQRQTIYAGCGGGVGLSLGGVWKSSDGGSTWVQSDSGMPRYSGPYSNGVVSLALDAAHPGTLIAGTVLDGVFRSTDGAASWSALNTGVPFMTNTEWYQEINAVAFDPHHDSRPSAVIDGHYFVLESGSWTQRSGAADFIGFLSSELLFHPTLADVIYAAGPDFEKSVDGGASWASTLDSGQIGRVSLSPTSPSTVLGARASSIMGLGGAVVSTDAGGHWVASSAGLTAVDVRGVAIDPSDPRRVYVGTGTGFVYSSHDGGASWSRALNGLFTSQDEFLFGEVTSMVVDPGDPSLVSIATLNGLFQSHDYGATFSPVAAVDWPTAIVVSAATTPPTYFVGTAIGNGVYRSTDGGGTWTAVSLGLPLFGGSLNPVVSVAIDPNDVHTVWAGTQYGGGILRSTDFGDHWQPCGLTEENWVQAISVRPGNSQEVLAAGGFGTGEIYKSTDGGATWHTKLTDIGFVYQLLRDPRDADVVYAASEGFGVLRSGDGGETWRDYTGSIFYPLVYSLAMSSEPDPLLLAGSYGAGLYWTRPVIGDEPRLVHRRLRRR